MMLFKLSLSNLRKSLRDYAVYFFTLVIGVAVFYVFNSIESQTAFLEISSDTREIIKLLISMLSGVSVFVAFVLGLLIVFASRFLMKRRNREFALYLMLGMSKGRISAMLFTETFFIGLASLVAGTGLGILVSQFTSAFAASLFEADLTEYHFVMSGAAVLKTALFFGIMYIAVMIFNGFMVGKYKLIDLMQSGKKSENPKLKNPVLCVVIFLAAAAALAYAYWNVTCRTNLMTEKNMAVMIAVGSISTFLVFWSVSGMLLRVIMSLKKVYFRGLNSFTFRQLSSKINTMVMAMTMISLMLFVTICTLSSAFSMRNSLNSSISRYCPADYTFYAGGSRESLDYLMNANDGEFLSYFSDYTVTDQYSSESLTIAEVLGDKADDLRSENPYLILESEVPVFRVSEYNKLMRLFGYEEIELDDGTYAVTANFAVVIPYLDKALAEGRKITVGSTELSPKYTSTADGFVHLAAQPVNDGLIVVPDDAVTGLESSLHILTGNFTAQTRAEKIATGDILRELTDNCAEKTDADFFEGETKAEMADSATGLGGLVIFIGLYIGVIFLISSGVILALRSLSDAVDSIPRYTMLRKIGAEESDILKSVLRQNLLFFALPLGVAVLHSVFGMKFAMNYVLQIFGTEGMAKSVAGSSLIILFIYGGYFLITYLCSKSIVKDRMQIS